MRDDGENEEQVVARRRGFANTLEEETRRGGGRHNMTTTALGDDTIEKMKLMKMCVDCVAFFNGILQKDDETLKAKNVVVIITPSKRLTDFACRE